MCAAPAAARQAAERQLPGDRSAGRGSIDCRGERARAAATSPVGAGTSCEAFNTVASLMAVALPAPFAPPATASVRPSTTAAAPEATAFFMRAPFLRESSSNALLSGGVYGHGRPADFSSDSAVVETARKEPNSHPGLWERTRAFLATDAYTSRKFCLLAVMLECRIAGVTLSRMSGVGRGNRKRSFVPRTHAGR